MNMWFWEFNKRLARMERILNKLEVILMATTAEILVKVQEQTTVIDSVKVLVEALKAAASDPVALQAIVDALDSNTVALGVIVNTPTAPPV